jgi:hypothetical protein
MSDRVPPQGESVRVGNDGLQTAFGQSAVTYLAATRSTNRLAFSDAVRREVVIQHEFLAVFLAEAVDALFIAGGAQCCRYEGLRFAACKDGRPVSSWQHPDFAINRANLLETAAVNTFAFED